MAASELLATKPRPVGSKRGMPVSRDEIALLDLIARKKDRVAFLELHDRYERPAYNLARFLTRSPELAEEAVQEAMLAVWKSAHRFVPGDPRAWVLRIVANKSMALVTRNRKIEKHATPLTQSEESIPEFIQGDVERQEELKLLRSGFSILPLEERDVLGLYFGVELTQREIAKQLSIPQTTVSLRIKNALKRLRLHMGATGLAAGLPATLEQDMRETICSSFTPPSGLKASLEKQLDDLNLDSGTGAATPPFLRFAAGFFLIAGMAGGYYGWSVSKADAPGDAEATPSNEAIALQTKTQNKALAHYTWRFDNGIPKELKVLNGEWTSEVVNKQKGIIASLEHPLLLKLPYSNSKNPFTIKISPVPARPRFGIEGQWIKENSMLAFEANYKNFVLKQGQNTSQNIMFMDEYIVMRNNGEVTGYSKYEQPYPGSAPCLAIKGYFISHIEFQELDAPPLDPLKIEKSIMGLKGFKHKWIKGYTIFPRVQNSKE